MTLREFYVTVDDITGEDGAHEVLLELDGIRYMIDLTPANHNKLVAALAPFTAAARVVPARIGIRYSDFSARAIREWARLLGYHVEDTGGIRKEITELYKALH